MRDGEELETHHLGMFKGFPSFVVEGVVVDMVASRVIEVTRGVTVVRSAVVLWNVCLLSVLNVCMLLLCQ